MTVLATALLCIVSAALLWAARRHHATGERAYRQATGRYNDAIVLLEAQQRENIDVRAQIGEWAR